MDGAKAATYLTFDYNQKRLVFNSGLETEGFQSLSVGILLAARIIDEAIQLGYSEFDLLRGDETNINWAQRYVDLSCEDGSIKMKPIKRVAMLSLHTCPLAMLGGKETGGMNVYVRDLSRELVRRGIAVDVFTRSQNSHLPHVMHRLGPLGRVIRIPTGPEGALR